LSSPQRPWLRKNVCAGTRSYHVHVVQQCPSYSTGIASNGLFSAIRTFSSPGSCTRCISIAANAGHEH
jgi:hypothetical protein